MCAPDFCCCISPLASSQQLFTMVWQWIEGTADIDCFGAVVQHSGTVTGGFQREHDGPPVTSVMTDLALGEIQLA